MTLEQLPNEQSPEVDEQKLLFDGVRGSAVKILNRVERTDSYLDRLVDAEFRSEAMNDLDKALLMEIVHGVLRWQMKLDWVLNGFFHGNFTKAEVTVKNALRVALYQIMFLDRVPHHAAVNDAVEFVKRIRGEKAAGLVNGVLRNIIRSLDGIHYPDVAIDATQYLAIMYSHPLWAVRRWMNRFGYAETEKLLAANNQKPCLSLRINTLKTNVDDFLTLLTNQNISFDRSKYLDNFITTSNLSNLSGSELFRKGYFSVQDESAGIATKLLDVQQGDRIIDLCAAPGGKTTYIGEVLKNSGKIIAVDKYSTRLELVKSACQRLGIAEVECHTCDGRNFEHEEVDKVLVDAPCTGFGVLSKKPDIKLKRDSSDVNHLADVQLQLLNNASRMVRHGGAMVYSTCTIEPEENFNVVRLFLSQHPEYSIDHASRLIHPSIVGSDGFVETLPHRNKMDGSFAIRLVKEG